MELDESLGNMSLNLEVIGSLFFGLAVLHTFFAGKFLQWSHHFPAESFRRSVLHLMGEIEVVFGLWAAVFYLVFGLRHSFKAVIEFHESLHFTEPLFVFCIMVVAATRPVLDLAKHSIQFLSQLLSKYFKVPQVHADLFVILVVGPISGSLITEPAAMTVTALLLVKMIRKPTVWFAHALIGLLFVNVSIGGALTPYAAPPILMVASAWKWDFSFVFSNFGWKSILAVAASAFLFLIIGQKSIRENCTALPVSSREVPLAVTLIHYLFLLALVLTAHHSNMMLGIFLFFIGTTVITKKYQNPLRFKESLLVAFFLGGIIVFGGFQKWWLEPLLAGMDSAVLFLGAVGLTAITDNAALTYLGSQVPSLTEEARYFLVAGAIAGGGLTIIANAPNAAGYGILQSHIRGGIHPGKLFLAALGPTLVAVLCLGIL